MSTSDSAAGTAVRSWPLVRWTAAYRLIPSLLQLGLVLLLIHQYQIESRTFFNITLLAVAGFAVHALLPLAHRLHFFVFLSFAGIGVAFGLRDGAWLIAAGMALIGICHLPLRLSFRVALLAGVGAVMALARGGVLPSPWSGAVWPILASMFMFRIALYLHALRHDPTPPSFTRALAYFFMLPNVAFPLFPVVDYSTFARTHYDRDPEEIYETGVRWIIRGVVQLMLYRVVYLYVVNDPTQLTNLADLLRYLLGTFLLYLRVSGSFHLIVGMLHLFGFRLPETHRLYYLASSFTDFWRRINIYWKDFMMKLVYYPSFFRLRRWGNTTALVGATLIVFFSTWLLHSYQWFWLRGGFPLTVPDILFWGLLGGLVVINVLRETRRGRKRALAKPPSWSWDRGIRTALMFWGMTVLWSLWSAESVTGWFAIWSAAAQVDVGGLLLLAATTAGFLLAGGYDWTAARVGVPKQSLAFHRRPAVQGFALLGGLLLAGQPIVDRHTGPRLGAAISALKQPTLNARDAALQHKGYYEKLDTPSRLSTELWGRMEEKGEAWQDLPTLGLLRLRQDFIQHDLHPLRQVNWNGHVFSTNRWGMRDRDYTLTKAPGTLRIALLGQSHVMGANVSDGEPFDEQLEERLNRDFAGGNRAKYEVLNFGVAAFSFAQELALLEERAGDFGPDVVIMTLPGDSESRVVEHVMFALQQGLIDQYPGLASVLRDAGVERLGREGVPLPFEPLRRAAGRLGISNRMPYREAEARVQKVAHEVLAWSIRRSAVVIREHRAQPVLLLLDNVLATEADDRVAEIAAARDAGFLVLDLTNVYSGHDPATLRVAPWDEHPNAEGHRLIADRLYDELLLHESEIGLGLTRGPVATLTHD